MPSEIYEVVALGARYWFLFLMATIVWRSYRWFAKDRRQRKKRLKLLPDAGFVGEMVVQAGNEELIAGSALPVPREGTLGTNRGCDLYVPVQGVGKKHLWFEYDDNKGLKIKTFQRQQAALDGEALDRRTGGHMAHGSRLHVGDAVLRLRLFAGFEVSAAVGKGMDAGGGETGWDKSETDWNEGATNWSEATGDESGWNGWENGRHDWSKAGDHESDWNEGWDAVGHRTLYAQAYPEADADETNQTDAIEGMADIRRAEHKNAQPDPFRNKHSKPIRSLFSPFEPLPDDQDQANGTGEHPPSARETLFDHPEVFYPPVSGPDDAGTAIAGTANADERWPYAAYPQSDATFEHHGYTYPEYVEHGSEDEDLTDAAAPPKSLYLEPDEAERAKRLLWDKYFGGGRKR